jgi:hypothetical protein
MAAKARIHLSYHAPYSPECVEGEFCEIGI